MSAADRVGGEDTRASWQGINHLALVTSDMDATVRFYHGTLGARLVATISTPEFRHYFFEFGPQCTVAFFEYADAPAQPFVNRAGVPERTRPTVRPSVTEPSRRASTPRSPPTPAEPRLGGHRHRRP